MDNRRCNNCNQVFDIDATDLRHGEIDVCPMDTGDALYRTTVQCPHCGYWNVEDYMEADHEY